MASPALAASRNDDGIHAGLTNPDTLSPPNDGTVAVCLLLREYQERPSKIKSSVRCTERSTSPIVMRPSAHDRRRVASTLLTVSTIAAAVSASVDDNALVSAPTLRCRELVEQRARVRIGRALEHDLDAHHLRVALERPHRPAHERAQLGLVASPTRALRLAAPAGKLAAHSRSAAA